MLLHVYDDDLAPSTEVSEDNCLSLPNFCLRYCWSDRSYLLEEIEGSWSFFVWQAPGSSLRPGSKLWRAHVRQAGGGSLCRASDQPHQGEERLWEQHYQDLWKLYFSHKMEKLPSFWLSHIVVTILTLKLNCKRNWEQSKFYGLISTTERKIHKVIVLFSFLSRITFLTIQTQNQNSKIYV